MLINMNNNKQIIYNNKQLTYNNKQIFNNNKQFHIPIIIIYNKRYNFIVYKCNIYKEIYIPIII